MARPRTIHQKAVTAGVTNGSTEERGSTAQFRKDGSWTLSVAKVFVTKEVHGKIVKGSSRQNRSNIPVHKGRWRSSLGRLEDGRRRQIVTLRRCQTEPRMLFSLSADKGTFSLSSLEQPRDIGRKWTQKANLLRRVDKMAQFLSLTYLSWSEWRCHERCSSNHPLSAVFFFLIFFEKCRQCGSGDSASKTLIRWSVPRSCNRVTRCHVTRNTSESMRHRLHRNIQWWWWRLEWIGRGRSTVPTGNRESCASHTTGAGRSQDARNHG